MESTGVIGDMRTTAMISRAGSLDFMCYPRYDSPAIFAGRLNPAKGGSFSIAPGGETNTRQSYLPDTNILVTRFESKTMVCEVVDFMPIQDDQEANSSLIRLVRMLHGASDFTYSCTPRFDSGATVPEAELLKTGAVCFSARTGQDPAVINLSSSVNLAPVAGGAQGSFRLGELGTAWFHLGSSVPKDRNADRFQTLLEGTKNYWRRWSARSTYRGRYREAVSRSALALKLLCSRDYGAIVAAATFGIAETEEGQRRWDYRYTWVRDASFSVYALLRLGYSDEARDFMHWISLRNNDGASDGSLRPMYSIDGSEVPEERILEHLVGVQGQLPLIGNGARDQLQLDLYGALIDAVYLYDKYCESTSLAAWRHVQRSVDFVIQHWREPDEGIWEFRDGKRQLLHSKLMCWVAIDRAVRIAQRRSLNAPVSSWISERDQIRTFIIENLWDAERRRFVQTSGSSKLDASVLMMPLVRFVGATDPAWLTTMQAIEEDLFVSPLMFRYRGDGLDGDEGAFSACSFWFAEALARAGRVEEGREVFEKMLTYANHLMLFSEQISLGGAALGNEPQALTHLALISAAFQIDRSLDGRSTI